MFNFNRKKSLKTSKFPRGINGKLLELQLTPNKQNILIMYSIGRFLIVEVRDLYNKLINKEKIYQTIGNEHCKLFCNNEKLWVGLMSKIDF